MRENSIYRHDHAVRDIRLTMTNVPEVGDNKDEANVFQSSYHALSHVTRDWYGIVIGVVLAVMPPPDGPPQLSYSFPNTPKEDTWVLRCLTATYILSVLLRPSHN